VRADQSFLTVCDELLDVRTTDNGTPSFHRPRQTARTPQVVDALGLAAKNGGSLWHAQEVTVVRSRALSFESTRDAFGHTLHDLI
jgi:hypothetical protein